MNEDRRYLRAAIRHEVMPVLERETGRGVTRSIARTGDLLRADRDELFAAVRGLEGVVDGVRGRRFGSMSRNSSSCPDPSPRG